MFGFKSKKEIIDHHEISRNQIRISFRAPMADYEHNTLILFLYRDIILSRRVVDFNSIKSVLEGLDYLNSTYNNIRHSQELEAKGISIDREGKVFVQGVLLRRKELLEVRGIVQKIERRESK